MVNLKESNNKDKNKNKNLEVICMLESTLRIQQEKKTSYETRASIVLGISITVILCLIQFVYKGGKVGIPFIIFGLTFFIAVILSILTLEPFRFQRKKRQKESIIYGHQIYRLEQREYFERVLALVDNGREVIKEYTKEIYNITKFAVGPRKRIFHLMIHILISGFILGSISLLCF